MKNSNHYSRASFILSAKNLDQLPDDSGVEVAFAGRSNTGKSSVINVITRQRQLARVSRTPGRTQLLNCFDLGQDRRLIDLPGYGYARVPEETRRYWGRVLEAYFRTRESLQGLVLIVDIRHGMKDTDRQMHDWCQANDLPLHVVLNKADKLSRGAGLNRLNRLRDGLAPGVSVQAFSSLKQSGREELMAKLDEWFDW
ncbi:MAG: ribosome biogenesis GTP-binding protein YihA/YsxC [Gammaproteobacteria bacterium]|nr:ribosome biogenesis GTP-binding protein YihA/YsxC [Gammaproteobacteria bacterium]